MASSFDQRSGSSASPPRDAGPFVYEGQFAAEPAFDGAYAAGAPVEGDQYWQGQKAPAGFDTLYGAPYAGFDRFGEQERDTRRNRAKDPRRGQYYRRLRNLVLVVFLGLLLLVGYVLVVHSPLFEIQSINANPTEHITSEEISSLAAVPAGSTLFGYDRQGIEERLLSNPWVAAVGLVRELPHTLVITVEERDAAAVVMLSNGTEAWLVATDGYWIEPIVLLEATADNDVASPVEQARTYAESNGLVYVSGISALIKPLAGTRCEDAGVLGVMGYLDTFTGALRGLIKAAKAPSAESISIVLTNGIEVSLGTPEDIVLKERVIMGLLEMYVGQMTYINVRTPTSPVWRGLDSQAVGDVPEGDSGAAFDSVSFATESDYAAAEAAAEAARREQQQAEAQEEYAASGELVGTSEGGPGGPLDWGGYYSDDGPWIYAYYDANGNWINGYYDENNEWVRIS